MTNDILAKQIIDKEYEVYKTNKGTETNEFESFIDLLASERQEKQYSWMSDIRIPEFISHILTQSSIDVGQYFQTRDFVEVYLQDESDEAKECSEATKECINRTLNQRHLYHYQKFVRAKTLNNLVGRVYLKCWWEQKLEKRVVGYDKDFEILDVDIYGNKIRTEEQNSKMSEAGMMVEEQIPEIREFELPVEEEVPVIDRFNYDVWDERNVFTDNTYVYSLQDKNSVIFRSEMTLQQLKDVQQMNGYDLKELEEAIPNDESETSRETYNKDKNEQKTYKSFDVLERYGKFWTLVEKDEKGDLKRGTEKPGIDDDGEPLKNAEFVETVITIARDGSKNYLIGYKLQPYIDASGHPFRPIIRGLCYIHPAYDSGMGDGKQTRELQIAIDDTFNISQDRTMLAALPTFKGKKYALDNNTDIYWEPMHFIGLEDVNDLQEFKISSDTTGALNQIAFLQAKMQQVDAVQPPSMGQTQTLASTTATSSSLASQGQSTRNNYKSLTFENTALQELYWMILQMTYRYASQDTALKLMGEKVFNFDPAKDFYYKPLSQSIETEQSKINKRKEWTSILGYVAQIGHPDTVKMVNYIFGEITKLMGDEYSNFKNKFLNEAVPTQSGGNEVQPGASGAMPMSNQSGMPMQMAEQNIRGM